jgi:hypothetical protein
MVKAKVMSKQELILGVGGPKIAYVGLASAKPPLAR